MNDLCPPVGELERLLADGLDAAEEAALEAHVAGCSDCQRRLELLTCSGLTLPSLPPRGREDTPLPSGILVQVARLFAEPELSASRERERPEPPVAHAPGSPVIGRYAVERTLGAGGFGTVYLGHDTQLDRPVAIKVFRGTAAAPAAHEPLLEEARRLARLRHPGIVAVHDAGVHEGRVYLVSDYLDGPDLARWLMEHRPGWTESVRVVAAVADALAHAHARRTVHRDVKPANILLAADGAPVLVDFGVALDEAHAGGGQFGVVSGTPWYMSPEQVSGTAHRIDGRTDIYSLGVVLYEMLTGRVPFRSGDLRELLRQVRDDEPQPPRQLAPGLPPELERVCLKAMAKKQQDRYTTASDFAADLRRLAGEEGASRRRESPGFGEAGPLPSLTPRPSISSLTPSSSRKLRDAERRQVTVLVCGCELFDSEEFLERLEAEDQARVLGAFCEACSQAVRQQGGSVVQCHDGRLLACFGFPVAHEDAAARAAQTGLALLEVGRLQAGLSAELRPWVGLHTGPAVVEEGEAAVSVVGEARTVAGRLEEVAEAGQVVCTEATRRLLREPFDCVPLGRRKLKSVLQPVELFRLRAAEGRPADAAPAGRAPLTGRDHEVGLLKGRWEDALEGAGRVVLIVGEAGLGKSRLVHTLKEHVRDQGEPSTSATGDSVAAFARTRGSAPPRSGERGYEAGEPGASATGGLGGPVIEWRCSPHYQHTGLRPVVAFVERSLGFGRDEAAADRLGRLVRHLEAYGLARPDVVPHLAALLALPDDPRFPPPPLSPVRQREETFRALRDWLHARAARGPVLFVVEDLHWADASTLEFLGQLLAEGLHDRVLALFTFRPEFRPPWPASADQTTLALTRLNRRQVHEMMQRQAGTENIPQALVERVYDRTAGVPLFVEEFTRLVQESGLLARLGEPGASEPPGSSRRSGQPPVLLGHEIPATLQDLVTSRLDRLAGDPEVAQLAAALGREFSYEVLAAVSPLDEPALLAELDKLVQAEIIYPRGRPPRCSYTFKHALLQDAAYNALIKPKRQQFHRRIAAVLEAHFGHLIETEPELLAHHFTEAGLAEEAVGYWLKAGLRSRARSANQEAIGQLRRGLALLETFAESPDRDAQELRFLGPLGTAYIAERGYAAPEVGPVFGRARQLCERGGEPHQSFAIRWGIFAWHVVRGEFRLSTELAAEAGEFARRLGDPGILMEALALEGLTLLYRGDFSGAHAHCARAVEEYDDRERTRFWSAHTGQDAGVTHRCYLALALWHLGYPDQALAVNREMLRLARAIDQPFSLEYALHHTGWLYQHCRLAAEVEAAGDEAMQIAKEQGFVFWHASGTLYQAAGLLLAGRLEPGLPLLQKGLDAYRATGAGLALPYYLGILGSAQTQSGRFDEARRALDEGLALADQNDDRFQEAELYRLRGELLLAESPDQAAGAEDCFRQAIDTARRQQSRAWELRATTSLARLWQRQGRPGDARRLLAPVHATFTEGFSTPDLMDAAVLLQALA